MFPGKEKLAQILLIYMIRKAKEHNHDEYTNYTGFCAFLGMCASLGHY